MPSLTVKSTSSDGELYKTHTVYATAHDSATGTAVSNAVYLRVGQQIVTTTYYVLRGGLFFDTSALPDDAVISATTLTLYVGSDKDDTVFDVTVVSGADLADPMVAADYGDLLDDITSMGATSSSGVVVNAALAITLNATGLAAISKTGTTKFALRSSRDINSDVPTGLEYLLFHSYEETDSGDGSYRPALAITYTTAPTVTTQAATDVVDTSCTGNGNITATGSTNCTRRGFCYKIGTSGDPTTADSTAYDDGDFGTGAYTKAITGLTTQTNYRLRAYAINPAGTGYGSTVDIAHIPIVTTQVVKDVVGATATGQGNITDLGGANATAHGHCWDTSTNPTTVLTTKTDNGAATTTGAFTSAMTGLTPGTGYYVRAYATNAVGTSYGANIYFVASLSRAGYIWMEGSNFRGFDENAVERKYIHTDDVDDTPVDAATTAPVSSNWAHDHATANVVSFNDDRILIYLGM